MVGRVAPRLISRGHGAETMPASVVGGHCETGGIIAADLRLPAGTRPGDLIAVPVVGACHLFTASGYNLTGRPPVVAVADGRARALVRRGSLADISSRDTGL